MRLSLNLPAAQSIPEKSNYLRRQYFETAISTKTRRHEDIFYFISMILNQQHIKESFGRQTSFENDDTKPETESPEACVLGLIQRLFLKMVGM
ncbi:hypothetical protein TNIN_117441 [Trichonephila inaurata madagascariensis]|uniref:Uncharacterized protein n=1 Tax=Trichonephila inaurata madagascariensis TaxID=2747483 RepID=A0A8X6X807_9ARAC|nr:hypothetical protein TNIN_117441 [Trichonephila inaurata madagascariensis]